MFLRTLGLVALLRRFQYAVEDSSKTRRSGPNKRAVITLFVQLKLSVFKTQQTNPLSQILQVEVEWLFEEGDGWLSALKNLQDHLKQLLWGGY